MEANEIVIALSKIYQNGELLTEEMLNEMLDVLDEEKEEVQFDSALTEAYRELNIWCRTEENHGKVLFTLRTLLKFDEISIQ